MYTARLHKEDVARMSPNDMRMFLTIAFQQNVGGRVLRYTVKKLYEDSVANQNRYKMKLNTAISSSLLTVTHLNSPTQVRPLTPIPETLFFDTPLNFQIIENPSTNMPLHFFSSHYFALQDYALKTDNNAFQYSYDYEIYTHILLHSARLSLTKIPTYYLPSTYRQIAANLHMTRDTVRRHLNRLEQIPVMTCFHGKNVEYSLYVIGEDKPEDILEALAEKKKVNPDLFYTPYGRKHMGIDVPKEENK